MARRIGAWSASAGLAGAVGALAGWAIGLPFVFAWGILLVLGALGALFLASGHEDAGESMLAVMLLRTDRWALGLAAVADTALVVLAVLAMGGVLDAPRGWAAFVALTVATLAAAGLLAYACSAGRGTARAKAAAARHHVLALGLALAPWLLRGVLPAGLA